ncbi:hypothetical protein HPB49_013135 [Dermacentor silvarum]|uniref:Uncharacterized protein n=1 Tax=Dermacentor silvarum TaxID=543639 RepID=A0ACB8CL64_DERSI|nr:hypothetical protein HPB49_013135 [Dermacentor silvarum]
MGNQWSSWWTESPEDELIRRTMDVYCAPEWRAGFIPPTMNPDDLCYTSRKEAMQAHADALKTMSPVGLKGDEACNLLRQTELHLAKLGIDMNRWCGKSDKGDSCYLTDKVDTVNTCLAAVNMRLKEYLSGHFVLKPMDVPFKDPAKEAAVKRAAVVVRWLVLRHRCVVELELDDSICRQYRDFAGIWLECLSRARCLRGLKLRLPMDHPDGSRWPLNEVWHVCWLRKLELWHVDLTGISSVPFEHFAYFMEQCTQLTELKLAYFMNEPKNATVLFRALKASRTLKLLSMDITCLERQNGPLVAEYLCSCPGLKTLDLTSSIGAPAVTLDSFISAVRHLKNLENLTLDKFSLNLECALDLAKTVAACEKLRFLQILNCQWLVPDAKTPWDINAPWRVLPLVMILELGTCLEYMALNLNAFDGEEVAAFFGALARNGKVRVQVGCVGPHSITNICAAARRTRTEERLTFSMASVDEVDFQVMRDAEVATLRLRTHEDSSPGAVYDCLAELPSCRHLITLELCLKTPLSLNEATPIAELLQNTTSLVNLDMDFSADKVATRTILEALAANRSVRFLTIKGWNMTRRNATFLSAVVQTRKKLVSLQFYCANEDKTSSRLVASSLAERITSNHTIFCADVRPRSGRQRPWLVLQAVTSRNRLLIERAMQFAAGDISTEDGFDLQRKRGAEALDLVASSYAWPWASTDVPQIRLFSEQRKNLRSAWLRTREMDAFMRLTGIVRQDVTCYPEPDGRPQLSTLSRDCWLHLRQFLKVGDVLDPTTSSNTADLPSELTAGVCDEVAAEYCDGLGVDEHLPDLCFTNEISSQCTNISGRRVVSVVNFIKAIQELNNHRCVSPHGGCFELQAERRVGFWSEYTFKCNGCGENKKVTTDPIAKPAPLTEKTALGVNDAAVRGFMSIGSGHSDLEEAMSVMEIPSMSKESFLLGKRATNRLLFA